MSGVLPHDTRSNFAFYAELISQTAEGVISARAAEFFQIDRMLLLVRLITPINITVGRKEFVTSFSANHCRETRFVTKQSHCQLKHATSLVKMPESSGCSPHLSNIKN
jgi:hypothetical protein